MAQAYHAAYNHAPMSRAWEGTIAGLRRRMMLAGALRSLERWLIGAVPLFALWLYLLRTPTLGALARHYLPFVEVLALVVLAGTMLAGALVARRSDAYCAKWIDLESQLADRLASAVEWSGFGERDPFQARCIEQLELELRAKKVALKLPRTQPRRWPLAVALSLALAGAALITGRHPPVPVERDAKKTAKLPEALAPDANKAAEALERTAKTADDVALEKLTGDLSSVLRQLQEGSLDRERSLERLQAIEREAARLAGSVPVPSSRAGGAVGALSRAMAGGDAAALGTALGDVAAALEAGSLDAEQLASLVPALDGLRQLANRSPAGARLASSLAAAAEKAESGDLSGAGRELAQAKQELPKLSGALAAWSGARRTAQAAAALEPVIAESAASAGGPEAASDSIARTQLQMAGASGAGASSAEEHPAQPRPNGSPTAPLQLSGAWNGELMRQFFESSPNGVSAEAKKLLVEHEQVVEDRFRRDDVPAEYRDAVRTYFAALHQRGH